MRPLSWTVSGTSTPRSASHPGTALRRPVAATTMSAARRAVVEPDAGDDRRAVAVLGDEPVTRPVRMRTPGSAGPPAAAPTRRWCGGRSAPQVLVARPGLAEVGGQRQVQAAGGEQRVEHVGEALAQLHDEAGEEAVGLVDLRGAPPLGLERLLGVGPAGQRVALEHGDRVAGPAEGERRAQPADPAADDTTTVPAPTRATSVW